MSTGNFIYPSPVLLRSFPRYPSVFFQFLVFVLLPIYAPPTFFIFSDYFSSRAVEPLRDSTGIPLLIVFIFIWKYLKFTGSFNGNYCFSGPIWTISNCSFLSSAGIHHPRSNVYWPVNLVPPPPATAITRFVQGRRKLSSATVIVHFFCIRLAAHLSSTYHASQKPFQVIILF